MKELSVEEKAKRYNEVLERAKDMLSYKEVRREDMEYLFPELKESEDERVRKCIGDVVREHDWSHIFGVTKDDCLAWLKKQEQKSTDNDMKEALRTEYEKGRADAIAEMQKPAWSEEDEEFLRRAINATKDAYPMTAKWLKSLRPQNKWKPSDEQMKALSAMNVTGGISYAGQEQELINLFNDLKKLKE